MLLSPELATNQPNTGAMPLTVPIERLSTNDVNGNFTHDTAEGQSEQAFRDFFERKSCQIFAKIGDVFLVLFSVYLIGLV